MRNEPIRPVGRRAFLRGAAGLAGLGAAGALSGCGSGSTLAGLSVSHRQEGSLDYWNLFGGGDGVRMVDMEDGFRKSFPNVGLNAVTLAWGNPYYTKLSLATLGQKPPDVAVAHLTRMKTLVAAGLVEELDPAELETAGMSADKFSSRPWQAGLVDGKIYALPLDTHPFVMFYNKDVCKKAGLLDGDTLAPMDSPEAFTEALSKAKKATGAVGGCIAVTNETATPWRFFQSAYSQLGGKVLADEGKRVVFDDDKALEVLAMMQSLSKKQLVPGSLDYEGSIATFANGDAGFLFQGEWEIATFQTAKMPFSMTTFPNIYGGADGYAVQADSHTLIIPKQPDNDPARRRSALEFIKSMLDQSKTWAEGGHVPAWQPFADSDAYRSMTPQSNYAAAADAAVYDPEGWYSGSGSNFEIVVGSSIGAVVAGQLEPKAALRQMHTKLGVLARTAQPT
ncbi:MAG: extracellular solute-binding protein [Nocardioidaceae bacterium]|nr:extracellular solute-binding protein [Nocardioidaceae bacterium]NUS52216.1 extracellular solute-binding protein [Nocardioidaceae bacterium]